MPPSTQTCPISGDAMRPVFRARLLERHDVEYFQCPGCGLLQTEPPHWLEEAYSGAIAKTDVGLVHRNLDVFGRAVPLMYGLHGPDARVLDAAGGYGMLARLLRDRGFDAYTEDEHCENLLCGPFEPAPEQRFDVVCAIEVMEHLVDPKAFLAGYVERHDPASILFSTVTFEGEAPAPDWWYYAPESGQHITFLQPRTIEVLAGALGFTYTPIRGDLHLFTREPLRGLAKMAAGRGWRARYAAWKARRGMRGRSRLAADYDVACRAARGGDDGIVSS